MIDAHHHLWRHRPPEFPWIAHDALRRDFLPEHLAAEGEAAGLRGTVAVQARRRPEENGFLLECARRHPWIRAVVGWVDLRENGAGRELERWAAEPRFRGVREILQGEPDDAYLDHPCFHRGLAEVERLGLTYDLLIFPRQLPAAIRCVDAHPGLAFVLDHAAKPEIGPAGPPSEWARRIRELALRPRVSCKLSGLATEVRGPSWDAALLRPYFDTLLDAFGPGRLMFGSDWPVCLARCSYGAWVAAVRELTASLGADERSAILGGTALRAYGLEG